MKAFGSGFSAKNLIEMTESAKKSCLRWKSPRFYVDLVVTLLALFLVLKAGKLAKPWEEWRWDRWAEIGPKPVSRATFASLGHVFSDEKLGKVLRLDAEKIAVWKWEDSGLHGHNFFLPIQVNWFLLPDPQQVALVSTAEEAQAYDWIIDSQSKKYLLEQGGREFEACWEEKGLFLYRLGAKKNEFSSEEGAL